jgi:phospholipid/cholesterol/gamma-HCH transport system permease protein
MGWVATTLIEPISLVRFVTAGFKSADFKDFLPPTLKTCVYGLIIGTIASFQGMRAKGGAQGVGAAATTSVVLSSLFVILADVLLVKIIILLFP